MVVELGLIALAHTHELQRYTKVTVMAKRMPEYYTTPKWRTLTEHSEIGGGGEEAQALLLRKPDSEAPSKSLVERMLERHTIW